MVIAEYHSNSIETNVLKENGVMFFLDMVNFPIGKVV